MSQVGDMIRATIVCVDGDGILEAWTRCSSDAGFRITPDHGRVKNSFRSEGELPKLLCNVHMDELAGYLPIVAEIQILLLGVYEIKSFNHRKCARRVRVARHHGSPLAGFYRIRRAPSIEVLLAENEAKLLKQSSDAAAAETAIKQQSARRVSIHEAASTDRYRIADSPQVHPIEVESRDSNSVLVADIEG